MEKIPCFRLTPTKNYTLNNRWHTNIFPKKTLFFIPADTLQLFLWIRFLINSHHRSFLYLHMVYITVKKSKLRVLRNYYNKPLSEILIKERDYNYSDIRCTVRVSLSTDPYRVRGLKKFLTTKY